VGGVGGFVAYRRRCRIGSSLQDRCIALVAALVWFEERGCQPSPPLTIAGEGLLARIVERIAIASQSFITIQPIFQNNSVSRDWELVQEAPRAMQPDNSGGNGATWESRVPRNEA